MSLLSGIPNVDTSVKSAILETDNHEQNVEVKFQVNQQEFDFCRKTLMSKFGHVLWQRDIFFNIQKNDSYLKLRTENVQSIMSGPPRTTLIFYHRPKDGNAKQSSFIRYVPMDTNDGISDKQQLLAILRLSLGVLGIVGKNRTVGFYDNVRVHLDIVENLGTFVEMEYCVSEEHPAEKGKETLDTLIKLFKLGDCKRIDGAYLDLIVEKEKSKKLIAVYFTMVYN